MVKSLQLHMHIAAWIVSNSKKQWWKDNIFCFYQAGELSKDSGRGKSPFEGAKCSVSAGGDDSVVNVVEAGGHDVSRRAGNCRDHKVGSLHRHQAIGHTKKSCSFEFIFGSPFMSAKGSHRPFRTPKTGVGTKRRHKFVAPQVLVILPDMDSMIVKASGSSM